jgi:hypothetical protein
MFGLVCCKRLRAGQDYRNGTRIVTRERLPVVALDIVVVFALSHRHW